MKMREMENDSIVIVRTSETWCSTPLFSGDMVGVVGAAMEFAQICSSEYGGYRGRIGCCRDEKWNYNRCVKKRTRSA
ncbi:hypothetical protein DEO72_LG8g1513 [Vigna unguiculata]|uniref:Uncharacterized protein n=1 Tax=Vigna unguiculata TaxID=3917 RepID=A0A4D6MTR7_VIGUN|nr:hypothetical protein DEO72_LG8g1513 [Vigna unguiculata]